MGDIIVTRGTLKARLLKCSSSFFVVLICCLIIKTANYTVSYNFAKISKQSGEITLLEKDQLEKASGASVSYYKNCVEKNVSLSKTPLPLTGLVSFPGSGNTWARHLIQQMTGLGTSSVYCDKSLRLKGFPYECSHKNSTNTIVVKTHRPNDIPKFAKIVLLVRNPYEAFLSFAHFKSAGHTKSPPQERLINTINTVFEKSLRKYMDLVKNTTENFKGPVYVLQYERLKTDMASELRKLAEFLDVSVTDRDISCTVKLQEGNFHRNSTDDKHFKLLQSVYSKDQLARLQETARLTEKQFKDAYGEDFDLRGSVEDKLIKDR